MDVLWPLDTSQDAENWWISQWIQSLQAAVMFKHHVLMINATAIENGAPTRSHFLVYANAV